MSLSFFVTNRDFVLRSVLGHSIAFKKNVPQDVPRSLHAEALERGALPCDEKGNLLPDSEQVEVKIDANDIKPSLAPEDGEKQTDDIKTAIRLIVERNKPSDFAGPTPSAAAVSGVVGYPVSQKDVRKVWESVRSELIGNK